MASYLPPVVTVFTGDIGDLLGKIAAAKAAIADLKASGAGDIKINVDTTGLTGAIAKMGAMNAAMNTGRRGVRLWGVGLMGWIKIVHNLFMVFGAQLIADTIGLVAFAAAAVQTLGPVVSNIQNLGKAWNTFSGAQKVAAVNLRTFMDRLGNHDIQIVTVFDTFLQLLASHMHATGGVVQQASNAFLNFATDIKKAMDSPAWQRFLGANTGVIQQDLSLLFKTLTDLATALVSLAHNFNFMGIWALTGFGMVFRAITFLNEANPTLARFALLTLAAYHAIRFLAGTRLISWIATTTGGLTGLAGAFRNFRMFGLVPTLGFMTGLSGAAISLGAGLAVVASALVGGILLARHFSAGFVDANTKMIQSMTRADQATGLNIAGYEKLSQQLDVTIGRLKDAAAAHVMTGTAAGHYAAMLNQDVAAQQAAANTARTLNYNFGFLEHTFGLTQIQAYQVAKQLGLLRTIGSQVFTAQDKSNITAYIATIRASHNPMTALQFDMQQAANATLNMTDQVQGLTNAFNVLLGPFATALQDTVTWKQGNEALKIALEKTHGAINLNTKAGQAAASMLATAIQNTIALSEAQANMPGHMSQAIGTIQKEIAYLRSLHSNSKIVQQALHDLQAQLDALHSKSITLTVNTVSTGGGIGHITIPGSGPGGGNRINAITGPSPGVAIGPSSVSVNASQPVIHNHVFIDSREVFGATQKRAVRRQKRNGFNGLTRVIR